MNNNKNDKFDEIVTIAGLINIFGLASIILSIFGFDPLTFATSITIGGIFIAIAIIIYVYIVVKDMRNKGVL